MSSTMKSNLGGALAILRVPRDILRSSPADPQPTHPRLTNIGAEAQRRMLLHLTDNNPGAYHDMVCLSLSSRILARELHNSEVFQECYGEAKHQLLLQTVIANLANGGEALNTMLIRLWRGTLGKRLDRWVAAVQSRYDAWKAVQSLEAE